MAQPARRAPAFSRNRFNTTATSYGSSSSQLLSLNLNRNFSLSASLRTTLTMNAQELSQYLADAPPSVVRLEVEKHFDALTDKQKRYAHFISK